MSGIAQLGLGLDALRGAVLSVRRSDVTSARSATRLSSLPAPARSSEGLPPDHGRGPDDRPPQYAALPVPDLVRRAQQGDAEAFGALYDRYLDTVYRYVCYRVGSRALAEDLTSETFLRALRRIDSFTWQGSDIGAWFVTIARNLVADHYRSSRYRLELPTGDVADVAPAGPGEAQAGPEDTVLAGLQADALLDAVRRLRPEQQECIALRFLQGLSVAETAAVMGKNDAAVKALTHRAVRSLGRLLREAGS